MTTIQSNVTSLTVQASTPPTITAGQVSVISATGETLGKYDPDPTNAQVYRGNGGSLGRGFGSWNSGAYAADFGGAYGSLIFWGGGDGDYWGTEVFAFDIASGRWSRLDEPSKAMDGTGYSTDAGFNTTYFEHVHNADNSVNDSLRYPNCGGTPAVPHDYDYINYERASAAYPAGRIIIPMRFAAYLQGGTANAHAYDLSTLQWSRLTSAFPTGISYAQGSSCIDTLRKRCWWSTGTGNGSVGYLDLSSTAVPATAQHLSGSVSLPWGPIMRYHAGFDAILISGGNYTDGTWGLWYMNPNNPSAQWTRLTVTGTTPAVNEYAGLGMCHIYEPTITDPETGRAWDSIFLYQEGQKDQNNQFTWDTQRIYKVIAPSGSVTGTWTSEAITMGGTTVTGSPTYSNGMYKRFSYASKAKAIVWYSASDGPVYAYQPAGLA